MNNKISDNNQKIVLKLRVISATIELVKKLASVHRGLLCRSIPFFDKVGGII